LLDTNARHGVTKGRVYCQESMNRRGEGLEHKALTERLRGDPTPKARPAYRNPTHIPSW
jgi:hypothetical protein